MRTANLIRFFDLFRHDDFFSSILTIRYRKYNLFLATDFLKNYLQTYLSTAVRSIPPSVLLTILDLVVSVSASIYLSYGTNDDFSAVSAPLICSRDLRKVDYSQLYMWFFLQRVVIVYDCSYIFPGLYASTCTLVFQRCGPYTVGYRFEWGCNCSWSVHPSQDTESTCSPLCLYLSYAVLHG